MKIPASDWLSECDRVIVISIIIIAIVIVIDTVDITIIKKLTF